MLICLCIIHGYLCIRIAVLRSFHVNIGSAKPKLFAKLLFTHPCLLSATLGQSTMYRSTIPQMIQYDSLISQNAFYQGTLPYKMPWDKSINKIISQVLENISQICRFIGSYQSCLMLTQLCSMSCVQNFTLLSFSLTLKF